MPSNNAFHRPANAVIFGASGGIGAALVDQLASGDAFDTVYAMSRAPLEPAAQGVRSVRFDLTDESSIAAAAEKTADSGPLDLVIVATGILHRGAEVRPEKSMRELDAGVMAEVLRTNTIGPTLIAKHFLPKLRRHEKTVFAALSARVGSIGDNRLGGWLSYRMSKSALNMSLRTLAVEHKRRLPHSIIVALHPGTVATDLSAPFSSNVADGKLFSPPQAAGYLLDVIDELSSADSGGFFAWDGASIEF